MTSPDSLLESAPSPYDITCGQCRQTNPSTSRFCEGCGAPLQDDVFDVLHAPALREGRKWMGSVAILYVIGGVIMALITMGENPAGAVGILILNLALAATQGGLWWWAKRAAFPAAVVSLTLYLTVILLDAVADPMTLVRGWLIKILFISALAKAIQAGLAVKNLQAEAARSAR